MHEQAVRRQSAPRGAGGPSRNARIASLLLALVVVELSAATAYIHLTLGGPLFTLNGFGYLALATVYAIVAARPIPALQRFGWLPRIALAGYTLITIGAYLVTGSYFSLGWIAKGIEVAIVGLLIVDMLVIYGDPRGWLSGAIGSGTARPGGGARPA